MKNGLLNKSFWTQYVGPTSAECIPLSFSTKIIMIAKVKMLTFFPVSCNSNGQCVASN